MPRPKRRIRLLRRGLLALVVLLLVGLVAWPLSLGLWETLAGPSIATSDLTGPTSDLTWQDVAHTRTLEVLAAAWCFWFGASLGSFLNVVVYRVPRGISLVWRPSNCPYCTTPIQARDNIPILGWLLLGGRCRACRLPISSRYPLVELTTALIFLTLYFVELLSGGANLPLREPAFHRGVAAIVFDPQWDLIGLYAYHLFLLCTLLTWSLIRYDGFRVPAGCVLFTAVVGGLAPALWPHLHPVPWLVAEAAGSRPEWLANDWLARFDTTIAGLLAGVLLGGVIQALWRRHPREPSSTPAAVTGMGTVGLFLGWQAAVSVGLLAGGLLIAHEAAANLLGRPFRATARHVPWLGFLALATGGQVIFWKSLASLAWWPGPASPAVAAAVGAVIACSLHGAAKHLRTLRWTDSSS